MKKYKVDLKAARVLFLGMEIPVSINDIVEDSIARGGNKRKGFVKSLTIAAVCIFIAFISIYTVPNIIRYTNSVTGTTDVSGKVLSSGFVDKPGMFKLSDSMTTNVPYLFIKNGYFENVNKTIERNGIKFTINRIILSTDSDNGSRNYFLIAYTMENQQVPVETPKPGNFEIAGLNGRLMESKSPSLYTLGDNYSCQGFIEVGCPDNKTIVPQELELKINTIKYLMTKDTYLKKNIIKIPGINVKEIKEMNRDLVEVTYPVNWKISFSWGKNLQPAKPKPLDVSYINTKLFNLSGLKIIEADSSPISIFVKIEAANRGKVIPGEVYSVLDNCGSLKAASGLYYNGRSASVDYRGISEFYFETNYFDNKFSPKMILGK